MKVNIKIIVVLAFLGVLSSATAQNTFPGSGNVGIGTGNNSPRFGLHMSDSNAFPGIIFTTSSNFFTFGVAAVGLATNSGSYFTSASAGDFAVRGQASRDLLFGTIASANSTNGNERMRIKNNGNVGIGTTAPTARLHVNGSFRLVNGTQQNGYVLTSDANGIASWQAPSGGSSSDSDWTISGNNLISGVSGNVGIGSTNPDEKLTVRGTIHAEEIKVDLQVPADYVFESYFDGASTLKSEYTMPNLKELEDYLKENYHLPEIPSAQEIREEGLMLKEMTNLLLQKIEELTLYTIEQEHKINALINANKNLDDQVNVLQEKIK